MPSSPSMAALIAIWHSLLTWSQSWCSSLVLLFASLAKTQLDFPLHTIDTLTMELKWHSFLGSLCWPVRQRRRYKAQSYSGTWKIENSSESIQKARDLRPRAFITIYEKHSNLTKKFNLISAARRSRQPAGTTTYWQRSRFIETFIFLRIIFEKWK